MASGLTTDIQVGNNTVPELSTLMSARKTYLSALTDFTNTPPAIK
jgi:hypothetical protein